MKLSDELRNQLSNYIAANYIEPEEIKTNYFSDSDVTKGSAAVFSKLTIQRKMVRSLSPESMT